MPPVEHHITGREYWMSLQQLADTPEFRARVEQEFPGYDPEQIRSMSRRRFLQLMGGSMALAGLTLSGCRRYPEERLAPHAKQPEGRVPGVSERYATMMELAGVATGFLVSSYDGRPIKTEGNEQHPYSLGATDAIAQAAVLELYDPDRSRSPLRRENDRLVAAPWSDFEEFAGRHFANLRSNRGKGLAVLSEATQSPTVLDVRQRLLQAAPDTKWFTYEPINRDAEVEGTRLAFGRPVRPIYDLKAAKVIASFDCDLLGDHPAKLRHARDWSTGRRTVDEGEMNRLVIAECGYSITGAAADHRIATRPTRLSLLIAALARELGIEFEAELAALSERERAFIDELARDLRESAPNAVVTVGGSASAEAQALAHHINAHLGVIGRGVSYVEEPELTRSTGPASLFRLVEAINAGEVNTLVILGGNPCFDAPGDSAFNEAMSNVATTVHLSLYVNETSERSTWHLPRAHWLETWGDGRAWDGTPSLAQPLIHPLFDGRSIAQILALMAGETNADGYDLVRRTWRKLLSADDGFEKAWRRALHDGVLAGSAWNSVNVTSQSLTLPADVSTEPASELEAVFAASPCVYDGRFANNAWLQETPQPLTKVTWDNPILISKVDADERQLETGDMAAVRIDGSQATVNLPVFIMPGQPKGVVTITLGYGRSVAGAVGRDVGFNAYPLRLSRSMRHAKVTLERTGERYDLACTQDHHSIDLSYVEHYGVTKRVGKKGESGKIIREASLAEYREDKQIFHKNEHGDYTLQLFDPPSEFNDPHAWGMAVDMNSCIGCNACVTACQAENNIPVVGKEEVANTREMYWIRIDRYFKGDPEDSDDVDVVHQPMMCVHCENAPCEQVCPVAATVHDTEGLNTMVYNRCIGTRYCANNCPYKVRRFNYFDYHAKDPRGEAQPWLGMPDTQQRSVIEDIKEMIFNPDVTVRMRGVMEKCTYCTQRISAAKIDKRNQGEEVQDGDIVTACQQACPTQAIVFGNLNDPNSKVSRLQHSQRAYSVLGELNTRPRTKYLAKVRNRNT